MSVEHQPLGYLLHRVTAALRSRVTSTVLEPLQLTFPEYVCLRLLSQVQGQSNAQLAREASVSRQAMNVVLQGLQDRGLITRPDAATVGRARPIDLTGAGAEVLRRADPGIRRAEDELLATLDADDRRDFRRILAALV